MGTEKRGFGSMSPEQRREVARKGGLSGKRHVFTSEEASKAGKKGSRVKWDRYYSNKEVTKDGKKES